MAHGSASSRHIVFYGILCAHEEGWQARDLIFGTVARIACARPPHSMWSSRYRNSAIIAFVYCTALVNISTASPYTRPHDRWRNIKSGASETSIIETNKEFHTANLPPSAFHNSHALSIRTPHPAPLPKPQRHLPLPRRLPHPLQSPRQPPLANARAILHRGLQRPVHPRARRSCRFHARGVYVDDSGSWGRFCGGLSVADLGGCVDGGGAGELEFGGVFGGGVFLLGAVDV